MSLPITLAVDPRPPIRPVRRHAAGPGSGAGSGRRPGPGAGRGRGAAPGICPPCRGEAAFTSGAGAVNRSWRFDAVIFDCDGVLVDSEGIAEEVWSEMTAELGSGRDAQDALRRFRGERFASCLEWLEAEIGRPLPAGFEREFRVRTRDRFARELRPIPGVAEMLRALPIPFCVASNGPRDKIELNLGLAGILPRFKGRIFSAHELGVWKPDPRFYVKVAAVLGFAPGRCAVVEDSAPGVRAALGAGMTVFAFEGADDAPSPLPGGAHAFREMSVLPRLLAAARPPAGN